MPLSIPEMQVGAQVAVAFDEKGRELKVKRKGVITKIVSQSGECFNDNSGVKEIWVGFVPGHAPEKVENFRLGLVKQYDRAAAESIRQAEVNAKYGDGAVLGDMNEPVVLVDQTDLKPNEPPVSPAKAKRHFRES